ncbi:methyltransferase domain-containing protein [Roseiflexus sp.]|uniref:methyltransferase domain-containing protein n=1 Tax=Roseiflexus sp. TaxID=2562120 RepID=UPI00398A9A9D
MFDIECDVLEGLETYALDEMRERFGRLCLSVTLRPGRIRTLYAGELRSLLRLRSVLAVYLVATYDVPRPRAFLGHQHLTRLLRTLEMVRSLERPDQYRTMRLSAAGEDSSVLTRLKETLAHHTGLIVASDEGDLLIRLRRAASNNGWEVLVRLSPRPLATRAWRVCNWPGSLNATLASVMMRMTQPAATDRVLNLASGSGTLLIERLLLAPARLAIGCDLDREALQCAQRNLEAAGLAKVTRLEQWDATSLPLETGSVDVLCADLPFGQLIGSHQGNEMLYPALIAESARVAAPGARMCLLTHEVRLIERVFEQHADAWTLTNVVRVRTGGMTPRVYLALRTTAPVL